MVTPLLPWTAHSSALPPSLWGNSFYIQSKTPQLPVQPSLKRTVSPPSLHTAISLLVPVPITGVTILSYHLSRHSLALFRQGPKCMQTAGRTRKFQELSSNKMIWLYFHSLFALRSLEHAGGCTLNWGCGCVRPKRTHHILPKGKLETLWRVASQLSAYRSRIYITLVPISGRTPELRGSAWGHGLAASARTPGHVGTAGLSGAAAPEELASLWRVTHLTALDLRYLWS